MQLLGRYILFKFERCDFLSCVSWLVFIRLFNLEFQVHILINIYLNACCVHLLRKAFLYKFIDTAPLHFRPPSFFHGEGYHRLYCLRN